MTLASFAIETVRDAMKRGASLAAAASWFVAFYPRETVNLLDEIGSWPSSEPELAAIQRAFR